MPPPVLPPLAEVQLLELEDSLDPLHAPPLTALLAHSMAVHLGERVLVVHFRETTAEIPAAPPATPVPAGVAGKIEHQWMTVPADLAGQVDDWRNSAALATGYDVVLLEAQTLLPAIRDDIKKLVDRLVYLTARPLESPSLPLSFAGRLLTTALLPANPKEGPPEVGGCSFPTGTCRLRFQPDAIAQATASSPLGGYSDALWSTLRETFNRWARFATDRAVGLSLGGGGALGYAHVPLIRKLHDLNVPIDMVGGVSFGAVVAGYYCVAGLDGLTKLVAERDYLLIPVMLAIVSGLSVELWANWSLGKIPLNALEVPFFPGCCDAATGTQYIVRNGTVGYGIRASGSAPALFAPTTEPGLRLLDGMVASNMTDDVLNAEGAELIVGSSVSPPPRPISPPEPLWGGFLGRILHEFNPLHRTVDGIRSLYAMAHTIGSAHNDLCDVMFNIPPTDSLPTQFDHAEDIIKGSESEAEKAALKARDHWQGMLEGAP